MSKFKRDESEIIIAIIVLVIAVSVALLWLAT